MRPRAQTRTVKRANACAVVIGERARRQRWQIEEAVFGLARLHRRAEHGGMFESKQVADLVRQSRFKVVSANRPIGRERLRRIQDDVGLCDTASDSLEEARATGRL